MVQKIQLCETLQRDKRRWGWTEGPAMRRLRDSLGALLLISGFGSSAFGPAWGPEEARASFLASSLP